MIQSWKDELTEALFAGGRVKGVQPDVARNARRRLLQLDSALDPDDLRSPPSNRLHKLTGDRDGQWSISVNMQYRICFTWSEKGPEDVEFTDYH